MVKYSPKENTYKEMYLINKFEKDIMENSLQNLQNSKKDLAQKITPENNDTQQKQKEVLQDDGKKISQTSQLDVNSEINENQLLNNPKPINTSINNDIPQDSSLIDNDSIPDKRVDRRQSQSEFSLSPTTLRKILDTEKRTIKKIKKISRDEKKRKSFRNTKVSVPRITRKMAKSNKKQNKRIIIKNINEAPSITPFKKKRKEHINESSDSVFHGWNI